LTHKIFSLRLDKENHPVESITFAIYKKIRLPLLLVNISKRLKVKRDILNSSVIPQAFSPEKAAGWWI